jgi:NADPH:quinone reductase-like Zn-dependent oxidoreductase
MAGRGLAWIQIKISGFKNNPRELEMQVVEIHEYGGPDVLKINERPDPKAGPGEVVVDIHAASVNAADWKSRRGSTRFDRVLPHVLGRDFSGVASMCGAGVRFNVGDKVFGVCLASRKGAYAEKIAISENQVTFVPPSLNHIQAAAISLAGLTAQVSIVDCLKVQAGEKLLIQGGAGGVGGMAIQIAKEAGATVGTTGRSENHDYLRSFGADVTIDYQSDDISQMFGDCDAVFDCVGPATVETTFSALRTGGRAAFIGMGRTAPEPARPDITSLVPDVHRNRARLERLASLFETDGLCPPVITTFALADIAKAHRLSEAGHVRGKIVLTLV